jgi:hypothetical protein
VRSLKTIILCVLVCSALTLQGETFELVDGRTVSGELLAASANDLGVQIKTGEGTYEKFTWAEFAQSALKELAQQPRIGPFVEPFIEIPVAERIKKTEIEFRPVPKLDLPAKRSLLGGLFGSSAGLFALLLIYGANIYAASEIARFRAYPLAMVCGISAAAPFIGPIVFLCLPTRMEKSAAEIREAADAAAVASANPFASEPAAEPEAGAEAGGLHFAAPAAPAAAELPETQVFQRGQFTFNRRFIETKFSPFFGVVRREADKDMQLIIKSARGEFNVHRISRISAGDLHAEVHRGGVSSEVVIPFAEIQEMKLKHKDAP